MEIVYYSTSCTVTPQNHSFREPNNILKLMADQKIHLIKYLDQVPAFLFGISIFFTFTLTIEGLLYFYFTGTDWPLISQFPWFLQLKLSMN